MFAYENYKQISMLLNAIIKQMDVIEYVSSNWIKYSMDLKVSVYRSTFLFIIWFKIDYLETVLFILCMTL